MLFKISHLAIRIVIKKIAKITNSIIAIRKKLC